MAVLFATNADYHRSTLGPWSGDGGADITFVSILRKYAAGSSDGNTQYMMSLNDGASSYTHIFYIVNSNVLRAFTNGSAAGVSDTSSITFAESDGWCALFCVMPSGTSTPRFHKYRFSDGNWEHENGSVALDQLALGGYHMTGRLYSTLSSNPLIAEVEFQGLYDRTFSDAELETLFPGSLMSLLSAGGSHFMRHFTQSSLAGWENVDYTGGTAVDTGASALTAPFLVAGPMSPMGSISMAQAGSAPVPPDPPPIRPLPTSATNQFPPKPCDIGWCFEIVKPSDRTIPWYPAGGSMSLDMGRGVTRSISGLAVLPTELNKLDLARDEINLYLQTGDVQYQMGVFQANELTRQVKAIKDPDTGVAADMYTLSLVDRFIRLRANDGVPQTIISGSDPSVELAQVFDDAGLPRSVGGSASLTSTDVTWDSSAALSDKASQLAELAGHRPPWTTNAGIAKSVPSEVADDEIIDFDSLCVEDDTVVVTENYLTAPNRVTVTNNSSFDYAVTGVWNAPASAPHSEANRGYVFNEDVQMQGVRSQAHAEAIAATLGERLTARTLSFNLVYPTHQLDGPVIISFNGALWMVDNWSVGLSPGSTMSVDATELIL